MRTADSVVLACWPPALEARSRVDADVLRPDLDVDLLRLRQHGDRGGGGVDAPARLGRRHALHAVHAGFEFQPRIDAGAAHGGDDLLVAADLALARREHLDLPAVQRGVALVHAEEVAGEERRLVAAGAGAHFEDGAAVVGRVARHEQHAKLVAQRLDARRAARGARPRRARASRARWPGSAISASVSASSRSAAASARAFSATGSSSASSRDRRT